MSTTQDPRTASGLKAKLANIDHAIAMSRFSKSVSVAAVVSGSDSDRENWEKLLSASSRRIFNSDGTTAVFSFREKIGEKTRVGNMLGTLLAYSFIKDACADKNIKYRDHVTLLGMLFGRGERISPITQARGNRKPAIIVTPAMTVKGALSGYTSIEEALLYFTPVAKYLERRGFRGILDKWGDETEIASVDLTREPASSEDLSSCDIIKFISIMEVTEELARQKDWVVFDGGANMLGQVPRNRRDALHAQLKEMGVKLSDDGTFRAGVSLGPVAVSYDALDIVSEVFAEEIAKPGVHFDFDPYFLMALAMKESDKEKWDAAVLEDGSLAALTRMAPGFFEKVREVRKRFRAKYGREINLKVFDLGSGTHWADIGQHVSMREKFMALNDNEETGMVARHIAGIPEARDHKGNIIVDSEIADGVDVRDSVIVNSKIDGRGKILSSVLIDSEFNGLDSDKAFSIRSVRLGHTLLAANSGLFESLGIGSLALAEGERHVSLLAAAAKYDLKVSDATDLRDKKRSFEVPILSNRISFDEAYRVMDGVSMEELEKRRCKVIEDLKKGLERAKMFKALSFGTSGLRDTVVNLTDMEVYINTRGFMGFLRGKGEAFPGSSAAVGGDLRPSTPRIMAAVKKAIEDEGSVADIVGFVPSPVLANYSITKGIPSIMVTGSHIPADRNGIKFTKMTGEVLKDDEAAILANVASAREEEYARSEDASIFDAKGMFRKPQPLSEALSRREAEEMYVERYAGVFPHDALAGVKIVVYQHSAVGRDILVEILRKLGAEVVTAGRCDEFLPVDTEKVSGATIDVLRRAAKEYKPAAIVSMDGDSDRPLFADETGEFIPGDKLGALVSIYLKPDFAAVPVSANPAVVKALSASGVEVRQTKIGSPYVIAAMNKKLAEERSAKVVSWESNGGFLTGSDWEIFGKKLRALPTRDAVLPILAVALLAKKEGKKVSSLVETMLPRFYTASGVVDSKDKGAEAYTAEMGGKLISMFTPSDKKIEEVSFSGGKVSASGMDLAAGQVKELLSIKTKLEKYFGRNKGFGEITRINFADGIRMTFVTPDGKEEISHMRPSGNAPEFRNYAAADTKERASAIAELRYKIVPEMVRDMVAEA